MPPMVAPQTQYSWLSRVTKNMKRPLSTPSGTCAVQLMEKLSSHIPKIR